MFCTNCGKKLNEHDRFCKYCGEICTKATKSSVNHQFDKYKQEYTNFDLEEIYFKANKLSFSKDKINFCAFLFGPYYLLYRKMYLYGSIWLFLNFFVSLFTNNWISFLFHIVLAVYFALNFNFLYQKKKEDDLKQINNLDKSEQITFCKEKGGTTIIPIIIALIISFYLSSFIEIYQFRQNTGNYNSYSFEEYYQ